MAAETKGSICPYFPPIPYQEEVAPSVLTPGKPAPGKINFKFFPCQGENCAIYERCMGESSPMALEEQHLGMFEAFLFWLEETVPAFYSTAVKSLRDKLFPPLGADSGPISSGPDKK